MTVGNNKIDAFIINSDLVLNALQELEDSNTNASSEIAYLMGEKKKTRYL